MLNHLDRGRERVEIVEVDVGHLELSKGGQRRIELNSIDEWVLVGLLRKVLLPARAEQVVRSPVAAGR